MNNTHQYHGNVSLSDDVYYKLYRSSHSELVTIVCMQWFDEFDYYQDRFIRNSDGDVHVFETESMATEKLNDWYRQDEIDPEYRRSTRSQNTRD